MAIAGGSAGGNSAFGGGGLDWNDPKTWALLGSIAEGAGTAAMPSRMPVPSGAALGMAAGGLARGRKELSESSLAEAKAKELQAIAEFRKTGLPAALAKFREAFARRQGAAGDTAPGTRGPAIPASAGSDFGSPAPGVDTLVSGGGRNRDAVDLALDLTGQHESNWRNIHQNVVPAGGGYNPSVGRVTGPSSAQGYYQITNNTWKNFAPDAGVDLKQYPNAMAAPHEVQRQVARHIMETDGVQHWTNYNDKLRSSFIAHGLPLKGPLAGGGGGRTETAQSDPAATRLPIQMAQASAPTMTDASVIDRQRQERGLGPVAPQSATPMVQGPSPAQMAQAVRPGAAGAFAPTLESGGAIDLQRQERGLAPPVAMPQARPQGMPPVAMPQMAPPRTPPQEMPPVPPMSGPMPGAAPGSLAPSPAQMPPQGMPPQGMSQAPPGMPPGMLAPSAPGGGDMDEQALAIAELQSILSAFGMGEVGKPWADAYYNSPGHKARIREGEKGVDLRFEGPMVTAREGAQDPYIRRRTREEIELRTNADLLRQGFVRAPDGSLVRVPGYDQGVAGTKGAETAAAEGAKYPYDIGRERFQAEQNRQTQGAAPQSIAPGGSVVYPPGSPGAQNFQPPPVAPSTGPSPAPVAPPTGGQLPQGAAVNPDGSVILRGPDTNQETFGKSLAELNAKAFMERRKVASDAATTIASTKDAVDLLDKGIISGTGAALRLSLGKALGLAGLSDAETVANTEAFLASRAKDVMSMIGALGAGTAISNADLRFTERAAAATNTLDEKSIREIFRLQDEYGRRLIEKFNKDAEKVNPGLSPYPLTVEMPPTASQQQSTANMPLDTATADAARAAIAQGAPRDAVIKRLREGGYDPKGL